jgi:hypothetical protein
MSISALAYKKYLTLDEAAGLILDGGKGISNVWSLLREAVGDGTLAAVKLVRHTRYDGDMMAEVYDPTGLADVHQTTIERTALVKWLAEIDYKPRSKWLFPDVEQVTTAMNTGDAIDWHYWIHLSEVRIWQAVFLSLEIDPDKHDPDYRDFDAILAENQGLSKRLKLLKSNLHRREFFSAGTLNMGDANLAGVQLPEFAAWAIHVGLSIPPELASIARSPAIPKLETATAEEKPLLTTERNTLLTIIAALCDYSDIKHEERGAAVQIAKLTEDIGAAITDDTIRKVLKQIPDALETRMK